MHKRNAAFVVTMCKTSFENDARMVILDIQDELGRWAQVRVPEGLMATVTGQFLRERLFGLH